MITINSKTPETIFIGNKEVQTISILDDIVWSKAIAREYFYFEDRSGAANTIGMAKVGDQTEWLALEYSTDKETWTSWDFSQSISLAANGKVYLRGNNTKFSISSGNYHYFESIGDVYAGGSVISLFDKTLPQTKNSAATMFGFMFNNMTHLVGVDTNLFAGIYYGTTGNWRDTTNMFYRTFSGCSSLVTPPDLSGLHHAKGSTFRETFNACSSLTSAALMNVTEIDTSTTNQFRSMYWRCTALTDASPMHVTFDTTGQYTFYQMFQGCTSLVEAPDLSSITTVGDQSMYRMFYNCTSLTAPPDFSVVSTVGTGSFSECFYGCSSLAVAYTPNISTWDTTVFNNWLYGVAASGTLEAANSALSSLIPTNSASGCPSGWTVVNL